MVVFGEYWASPPHGAALPINRVGVDALRCDVMLNNFRKKKVAFSSSDCLFSFRWCPSLWFNGGSLANCFKLSTVLSFSFLLLSFSGLLTTVPKFDFLND